MELKDLIVTPFVLLLVYALAYIIKPYVTDELNRRYFIPALTVRIFGALALGAIYQFYYQGGDTYNFHTYGSRYIWEAFWDSPEKGLKLLFSDGSDQTGIYKYSSKISLYKDRNSFVVIRVATLFDLLTFSTYSATAVFFAVFSFIGSWMLFLTFYAERKGIHRLIAFATLFIPSVCFWGSGILKDTLTLGGLGMATYLINAIFVKRRIKFFNILFLFLSLYLIYSIKKYILLCYLPAAVFWVFTRNLNALNSKMLKFLMFPMVVIVAVATGYLTILQLSSDDQRYNLEALSETAKITAYDIAYQTGRDAGSTYSLGQLDGSMSSLVSLAPKAINVSLFRPYLWEVNNPLMFFAALESIIVLILTLWVIIKCWKTLLLSFSKPDIIFCIVFSITFAFAVGVSTYNFGSLSRYKIPFMPFYFLGLILIYHQRKSDRNTSVLEDTEY